MLQGTLLHLIWDIVLVRVYIGIAETYQLFLVEAINTGTGFAGADG